MNVPSYLFSAEEMRLLEDTNIKLGLESLTLMESAGSGAARTLLELFPDLESAWIFCGAGNNGGDGFVMARHLVTQGVQVDLVMADESSPKTNEALKNFKLLSSLDIPVHKLSSDSPQVSPDSMDDSPGLLVDAVFGTGVSGPLKGPQTILLEELRRANGKYRLPIISLDLPSGLNGENGRADDLTPKAQHTFCFGYKKLACYLQDGPVHAGQIHQVPIGLIPPSPIQNQVHEIKPEDATIDLSHIRYDSHKKDFGHALIFAGSKEFSGAAVLASKACSRIGAGLVTLACPKSAEEIIKAQLVEEMSLGLIEDDEAELEKQVKKLLTGKSAVLIGPGFRNHDALKVILRLALAQRDIPIVLDAEVFQLPSEWVRSLLKSSLAKLVITPHPGEMARLFNTTSQEIQNQRIHWAKQFQSFKNLTGILKGAHSLITSSQGMWLNTTGNAMMASGGNGDVLAGTITGLLAMGQSCEQASISATYLHGLAGDQILKREGLGKILPSDLLEQISHFNPQENSV